MTDPAAIGNTQLTVISADPMCASARLSSLDEGITPTANYFIRNHFGVPNIDVSTWSISIWGEVDNPVMVRYDELLEMPSREMKTLLECAGNSRSTMQPPAEGVAWDHGAVGTARWKGVSVSTVLNQASVREIAKNVLFEGADYGRERNAPGALAPRELSYAMSLPMEKVLHPDTMLAYEMNGETLPPEHGYPVRLLVPGWYGMASVKWLANIRVLEQPFRGFHENDYYVYVAEGADDSTGQRVSTIKVKSLITSPSRGELVPVGTHKIRGVAWSGQGPITKVEVSTDDGVQWHEAEVERADSPYGWQHWEYDWETGHPGHYLLRARAVDEQGNVQPSQAQWNFRGYSVNSIHVVPVTVHDT